MTNETQLKQLGRWVGSWTTEATHPAMAGVVVDGTAEVEWLEGERFLIHRARNDHADFPDSISILGFTGRERAGTSEDDTRLCMHYYDSRGVSRDYDAAVDHDAVRLSLDAPGIGQRFTGRFVDGGARVEGQWEMCEDGAEWHADLKITYRRA